MNDILQAEINDFCRLVGVDQGWATDKMFKRGCEFSEEFYPERIALKAQGDPAYWHWWMLQWRRGDEEMFANTNMDDLRDREIRQRIYSRFHSLDRLRVVESKGQLKKVEPWIEIYERIFRAEQKQKRQYQR